MNEFKKAGADYWFTVRAKNKKIILNWSNVEVLKKYVAKQSGAHIWKNGANYQVNAAFFYWLQWVHDDRFNAILQSLGDLSNIKSVLDVGSGVSIFDLSLSQILTDTKFTLLDKTTDSNFIEESFVQIDENGNYPFYNNWEIVEDCISASKLNRHNFNFIGPNNQWPETDLIVSLWSWCWHYPKETYWDKAMTSLRTGGHLVLDVLYKKDIDIIDKISSEMKCEPTIIKRHPVIPGHPWRPSWKEIDGYYGGLYKWTRK
jgi:SAM-dependent methyltransferase